MMGFQFAAGRRQAAFNNFLMEAWRPSSAPVANVETLILTGVIPKNKFHLREWRERVFPPVPSPAPLKETHEGELKCFGKLLPLYRRRRSRCESDTGANTT